MSLDISVIIPAFNIENYIAEALESALRQNPPFAKIIIVDDGSTDDTQKIIKKYNDPRIQYHYQENQGLGPARNAGIELAKTEYIYFMDGDDILESGMTQHIQEQIDSTPCQLDAILFSAIDFDHDTGTISPFSVYYERKRPGVYDSGRDALFWSLRKKNNPAPVWLYVFKKSILKKQPQLKFLNILHEDEIFTPDLLLRCGTTTISNKVLYRRRVRSGSIMTSVASIRNVHGSLMVARYWLDRTSATSDKESHSYFLQAHAFYCKAILYALRAKIEINELKKAASETTPEFIHYIEFDYKIGKISRRIAYELGLARSHIISFLANH
ncbi:MAG: glycosyltransferase [Burkholderiaceae bacterium]|nr:glycosyltransferase [Burkholderiaceae bacterium]